MIDYSLTNIIQHVTHPTYADLGNAFFEFGASIAIWISVRRLYLDKILKGWSKWSTIFFASWGFYNTFYYPSLNQWCSFLAGLSVVTANCSWIYLVFYYAAKDRVKQANEILDELSSQSFCDGIPKKKAANL